MSARLRRPVPVILGILCATLLNHSLAGLLGGWLRAVITPDVLRWGLGASFIAIALWALRPDTLDENPDRVGRFGAFALTFIAFFIAEIGDKTQLATVALAARFDSLVAVVAGTTAGMLVADIPAVLLAQRASGRMPFRAIRYLASALFAAMGIAALAGFNFG